MYILFRMLPMFQFGTDLHAFFLPNNLVKLFFFLSLIFTITHCPMQYPRLPCVVCTVITYLNMSLLATSLFYKALSS